MQGERSIPPGIWPELVELMRRRGGELLRLAGEVAPE